MSGSIGTYWQNVGNQYATVWNIPTNIFSALIGQESGFNPSAYNQSSGATGIAQILPSTAANPGYGLQSVDPTDPNASLSFAAQYLNKFYNMFGNWSQALLAYNKGPGYAAANPNETPYPNVASIQTALAGANGSSSAGYALASATGTGSLSGGYIAPDGSYVPPQAIPGVTPDPNAPPLIAGQGSSGVTEYFQGLLSDIEGWITQAGLIVVGIIVIAGGLYLLKERA